MEPTPRHLGFGNLQGKAQSDCRVDTTMKPSIIILYWTLGHFISEHLEVYL